MSRSSKYKGPAWLDSLASCPPVERQLFPTYAQVGLPRPTLMRVAVPDPLSITILADFKEKVCGFIRVELPELERRIKQWLHDVFNRPIPPEQHIFFQLGIGPQIVYHHPFHMSLTRRPSSELDAIIQAGVNITLHSKDKNGKDTPGFELQLALQGSCNFTLTDPTQAGQGQLQLQLGYFVPLGGDFTFSVFVQGAAVLSYQYAPTQTTPTIIASATAGLGLGLSYKLSEHFSVMLQVLQGPNFNPNSSWDYNAFLSGVITF